MTATELRYQLPKKAIKGDCPDCSPRHRKTLSLYIDTRTGEPLPDIYGRCDRESNCGYHLSPYHKDPSGMSYASAIYEQWKTDNPAVTRQANQQRPNHPTRPKPVAIPPIVHSILDEVYTASIGHYDRNQFAWLLRQHFGMSVANELLQRFQIGTSSRWPGACVFWYIDEQERKRGGQIKLFGQDWHTVKYVDQKGVKRTKTSWVHSALIYRCKARQMPVPDWLTEYDQKAERSPCLFGLSQLQTAYIDQPVAIVEAPKTAVLCTPYFPQFVWLAIGALSYLTTSTATGLQRLAPLKGRKVILVPDLSKDGSAFARWSQIADELCTQGFTVTVSDYIEQQATEEQKAAGLDVADYLLDQWAGYPPNWDSVNID